MPKIEKEPTPVPDPVPETSPKEPQTSPNPPETTPKVPESTPKVPEESNKENVPPPKRKRIPTEAQKAALARGRERRKEVLEARRHKAEDQSKKYGIPPDVITPHLKTQEKADKYTEKLRERERRSEEKAELALARQEEKKRMYEEAKARYAKEKEERDRHKSEKRRRKEMAEKKRAAREEVRRKYKPLSPVREPETSDESEESIINDPLDYDDEDSDSVTLGSQDTSDDSIDPPPRKRARSPTSDDAIDPRQKSMRREYSYSKIPSTLNFV